MHRGDVVFRCEFDRPRAIARGYRDDVDLIHRARWIDECSRCDSGGTEDPDSDLR
jgi:hypothetical protein